MDTPVWTRIVFVLKRKRTSSVDIASDTSSVESYSMFFTCRLRAVTYQTLFTQTQQTSIALPACDSKLPLRMTEVSNENNINRPSSAQSSAIIISSQSRRRKEACRESRALWVGIMHIKKMSTFECRRAHDGVAACAWAIKRSERCYWQCWLNNVWWLSLR